MTSSSKVDSYLWLAQLELQKGKKEAAKEHLKKAVEMYPEDAEAQASLGNYYYSNGQYAEARTVYESVLAMPADPKNLAQVYYRMGKIYLDSANDNEQQLKLAKTLFIRACQLKPSSSAWLGVGKVCFLLQEYADAEDALSVTHTSSLHQYHVQ